MNALQPYGLRQGARAGRSSAGFQHAKLFSVSHGKRSIHFSKIQTHQTCEHRHWVCAACLPSGYARNRQGGSLHATAVTVPSHAGTARYMRLDGTVRGVAAVFLLTSGVGARRVASLVLDEFTRLVKCDLRDDDLVANGWWGRFSGASNAESNYRYITHRCELGRYITHLFLWIRTLHHPPRLRYITHRTI